MLDIIYDPVSALLYFWHKGVRFPAGSTQRCRLGLAGVFLALGRSAVLFKPFVSLARRSRKRGKLAPEIQELRKEYGEDPQKLAAERRELWAQDGVRTHSLAAAGTDPGVLETGREFL